jgi:hypothetical protein
MSVVAGVLKAAASAKMMTETRPAKKAFPKIKRMLVVRAVALFVLAAFAALIPASILLTRQPPRQQVRTLSR